MNDDNDTLPVSKKRMKLFSAPVTISRRYWLDHLNDYDQTSTYYAAFSKESINYINFGRSAFQPCKHWKYEVVMGPSTRSGGFSCQTSSGDELAMAVSNVGMLLASSVSPAQQGGISIFEADWDTRYKSVIDFSEIYNYAYRRLQDVVNIKRQISIINFIYELKDVQRMFEFWSDKRSLLANIANGHLNFKYGWKPFISDVVSIAQQLQVTREKLKDILEHEGKVRLWRGATRLVLDPVNTSYPAGLPMDPGDGICDAYFDPKGGFPIGTTTTWTPAKVRCTVKYSYFCKKLSETQARVRAQLDAIGVQWDPQIIYDAIPFTFVVDWFFRLGDLLHDLLAIPNYPIDFRIHDACFTLKVNQYSLASTVVALSGEACNPPFGVFTLALRGTQFVRRRHLPSKNDLLYAGWGSKLLSRVHTGAALVVTNTPRPRDPARLPRKPRKH